MAAGRCTAAYHTEEWHGYGCSITEGACMFLFPDSKACAEEYGEGPDIREEEKELLRKECEAEDDMKSEKEQENQNNLFKLIQANPNLPVVPMVDYEVVCDDSGRWMGSWGSSYIGEYLIGDEQIHFRDDDDPSEVEEVLSEEYKDDYRMNMTAQQEADAYAALPWIKAIIVNIDLPKN